MFSGLNDALLMRRTWIWASLWLKGKVRGNIRTAAIGTQQSSECKQEMEMEGPWQGGSPHGKERKDQTR